MSELFYRGVEIVPLNAKLINANENKVITED
jgi:hypothetical protein